MISKEEFTKAKSILLESENSEKKNEDITKKEPTKKEIVKKNLTSKKKLKTNEDLTNTYASLQDVDELGTFTRINYSPEGMFDKKKHKTIIRNPH